MRIPQADNFSTRCRISHRPPFRTQEPLFYRCSHCGSLTVFTRPAPDHPEASGKAARPGTAGKSVRAESAGCLPVLFCCGEELSPLPVCHDPKILEEHKIEFTLFGGFEKNAARITVGSGIHPMRGDHRIEWVYAGGFQGGQLKYLPAGGSSKAQFAFADEDAYAYCDRPVCRMGKEHCQFQCKRGLIFYAYCSRHGLFRLEI